MKLTVTVEYTPAEEAVNGVFSQRITIDGLSANVNRACGCHNTFGMKPGKGGWKNPSNTKFLHLMALSICPPCRAKLDWLQTMPK